MGSNFTSFHDGCHGPVPLRGLFRGRTPRKRRRSIIARDKRAQGFSVLVPPQNFTIRTWALIHHQAGDTEGNHGHRLNHSTSSL